MRKATKNRFGMKMGESTGVPARLTALEVTLGAGGIGLGLGVTSLAAAIARKKLGLDKAPEIDVTLRPDRKNGGYIASMRDASTSAEEKEQLKKLKKAVKAAQKDLDEAETKAEKKECRAALKEAEEELSDFLDEDADEDEDEEEEPDKVVNE